MNEWLVNLIYSYYSDLLNLFNYEFIHSNEPENINKIFTDAMQKLEQASLIDIFDKSIQIKCEKSIQILANLALVRFLSL